MKNWIQKYYPDYHASYPRLRAAVNAAWAAVGVDELDKLVKSMPQRCQAVIDANGLQTPY